MAKACGELQVTRVHDGCGGWSDGEFAYVTVGHAIYIPLPFAKSVPLSDREGDIASACDDDIGLIWEERFISGRVSKALRTWEQTVIVAGLALSGKDQWPPRESPLVR
jgi:hypothetical protein